MELEEEKIQRTQHSAADTKQFLKVQRERLLAINTKQKCLKNTDTQRRTYHNQYTVSSEKRKFNQTVLDHMANINTGNENKRIKIAQTKELRKNEYIKEYVNGNKNLSDQSNPWLKQFLKDQEEPVSGTKPVRIANIKSWYKNSNE